MLDQGRQAQRAATLSLGERELDLHVICNSHLDHEWTHDFQFYRMLTVKFLDSMLEIMERVPDYQFLLDSQTVPLEDYLEIRPKNRVKVAELVAAKRLWVGPWYTAPDMTCVFGESIVRNLLIGHQIARSFGNVLKEGYTPFGFGQCSQLPQIYAGFGIDSIWFYRGVTPNETPGYVFQWQGADGTTALCVRTTRYNYYFGVMRPVTNGGGVLERDFDPLSGKKVMHFCDPQRAVEHAIVTECRHQANYESVEDHLVALLEQEASKFPGKTVALMNGMDTSMPTMADDEVLQRLRQTIPSNWRIAHSSMPEFFEALRQNIEGSPEPLPLVRGERRATSDQAPVLGDILTARSEQKRRNAEAEIQLQRYAEPLATVAWLLGDEYPARYLELAWKHLLRAQPHDTIGGTGVDQIEADMLSRLDQCLNITGGLQQFAMSRIVDALDLSAAQPTDQILVLFNPSSWERSECVPVIVDLPDTLAIDAFEIVDLTSGQQVAFAETSRRAGQERVTRDIYDATTSYYCSQVSIDLVAERVPPFGYRCLAVRKKDAAQVPAISSLISGANVLENAYVRLTVGPDGSFTLFDKKRGRTYEDLHVFIDRGEAGDPWLSRAPTHDKEIASRGGRATISVVHDSPLRACLKVVLSLQVPAGLTTNGDRSDTQRSSETVTLPITSYITLSRDHRAIDIRTVIENTAKNHTLQVLFPTNLNAAVSYSDTAFDVVERPIARQPAEFGARPAAEPCLRFVEVHDGQRGLAVPVRGVRGYHVTETDDRAIALTLLRSYDTLLCTVTGRSELRLEQEGSHALGRHEVHYGIFPHGEDWRVGVAAEGERLNCPLLIAQTVPHGGTLAPVGSFVRIETDGVELSAIKKAERCDTLIVRLFNTSDEQRNVKLSLFMAVLGARLVDLDEQPIAGAAVQVKDRDITFPLGPRKIITLEIECTTH